MTLFRDRSIQTKLAWLIVAAAGAASAVAAVAFVVSDVQMMRRSMTQRVWAQAGVIGAQSTAALDFDNPEAAREILTSLREEPVVVDAVIYTPKGRAFARFSRSDDQAPLPPPRFEDTLEFNEAGDLDVFRPIVRNGERLGSLHLRASMADLRAQFRQYAWIVGIVFVASLGVAFVLSTWLQRFLSAPILRLADVAKSFSTRSDYSVRVTKEANDEIGVLYDGFNAMLAQIQKRDDELAKHRETLEEQVRVRTADLEVKTREALAASVAKSEFLANMSHEIRTPMNGIIGITQIALKHDDLTPAQRENLELVMESGESLMAIINDILDFSKIDAGKMTLDPVEFDLRDSLADSLRPLAIRAHMKSLELACHVSLDTPAVVLADAHRLRQIVNNLVGNAIKFTENGEIVVDVAPEGIERPDAGGPAVVSLHFRVKDTGIGIPVEKQETIFEAFTQADGSTTRRFGGTGLGLTICSRLVALMGGRIWVESRPGDGSVFHFTVKAGIIDQSGFKLDGKNGDTLANLPVLVVDDNPTNRKILREMLTGWGMQPHVVAGPNQALEALEQAKTRSEPFPSLLLLDSKMPGMDGFELAEAVRQGYDLAKTTILMLTSEDVNDKNRLRSLGLAGCLVKPIKQSALLNTILDLVERTNLAGPAPTTKLSALRSTPTGRRMLPKSPPLKILVTEDNHINRRVAKQILTGQGHDVSLVENGQEALDWLANDIVDLVFMDLQMPVMGGLEATSRIREAEKETGRHLPIVAMTAHAIKGDKEKCLAAGMDNYVTKPLREYELCAAIAAVRPLVEAYRRALPIIATIVETKDETPSGLDLATDIRRTFVAEADPRLANFRTALTEKDLQRVRSLAHEFRGMLGYLEDDAAQQVVNNLQFLEQVKDIQSARLMCESLAVSMDVAKSRYASEAGR